MTWIISRAMMEAYENSPCSQGLVEGCLEGSYSDGERFAPLNVIVTPHPFWLRDKTTDVLSHSRFGAMSRRLGEKIGEDVLTWFREGFPVRISPQQINTEKASEEKKVSFGIICDESYPRYSLQGYLWKTLHSLFPEVLDWSSATLTKWGMMQNGVLSALMPLDFLTKGKGFGFTAPTPTASQDFKRIAKAAPSMIKGTHGYTMPCWIGHNFPNLLMKYITPKYTEAMMGWPIGWTDLEPLETDKFQQWLELHGKS